MAQIITAAEAANLIQDEATVGLAGMGLSGWPEEIAVEIAERFTKTEHPANITLKQGSAMGDWKERGVTRLGLEGLVAKWSAAHIGSAFSLNKLVLENKIGCHCLPQGVIVNLWREIAAGRPGLITKVGLGTYVDPRKEGGKMNEFTSEELVELINVHGEEYLFYKSFPVDVALLRGSTADQKGNITFSKDGSISEGLAVAQAAKNSGGIVIVQVEYLAKQDSLHPKKVQIPGALVDYVVVATDKNACWQTEGCYYDPVFSGDIRKPLAELPKMPLSPKKVIARRAAMEVRQNNVVNLGYGIPSSVADIMAEEGYMDRITMTTEVGSFGGVPASAPNFGNSYNAEAIIPHGAMFDFLDGGGVDVAVLGLAQTDEEGNINVSKFGKRLTGPGGFIDIAQGSKKVLFTGTFNAKSESKIEDGKLIIEKEGIMPKFIKNVEQITFSGKYAGDREIYYITERAVFKLIDGKVTLIETAPGVDIDKDILPLMDFTPGIATDLKTMDETLFNENWGGLDSLFANTSKGETECI